MSPSVLVHFYQCFASNNAVFIDIMCVRVFDISVLPLSCVREYNVITINVLSLFLHSRSLAHKSTTSIHLPSVTAG